MSMKPGFPNKLFILYEYADPFLNPKSLRGWSHTSLR